MILASNRYTTMSALTAIKEVDIDPEGVFKYILIKVHEDVTPPADKVIVRGYKRSPYHADIYEEVEKNELAPQKLDGECLGGGRIQHNPDAKSLKVYGYSQGFGKADHQLAVSLLKKVYPNYNITCSDEGY